MTGHLIDEKQESLGAGNGLLKTCAKCGVEKPATASNFYRAKRGLFGLRSECKDCASEDNRRRKSDAYWADPEAARRKKREYNMENKDAVAIVRRAYAERNRQRRREYHRRLREANHERHLEVGREYYRRNAEALREKQRQWRVKNRDHAIQRGREYRQRNIEKIREQERRSGLAKFYRKYGTDVAFTLKMRTSALLRASLRGGLKSKKTVELLGYTVAELRDHLEARFTEGMTWERFMAGDIHIDHIRPVSSFSITSEDCADFRACWSLGNLQPLWAADNIRKGHRYGSP